MPPLLELAVGAAWQLEEIQLPTKAQAPSRAAKIQREPQRTSPLSPTIPPGFLLPGVTVSGIASLRSSPVTRGQTAAALEFNVPLSEDEHTLVAARHPSGAITFHAPIERSRARGGKTFRSPGARFQIPVHSAPVATRGILTQAVKLIVLKFKDSVLAKAQETLIGLGIQAAGRGAEWLWWKEQKLAEGWFHVAPNAPTLRLTPVANGEFPGTGERSLLFLHGTFSNAASAFGPLADSHFFDAVRPLYGDRIFAFNHFSISRSPEQNCRQLLESLANRPHDFDVITHSRGGLVLRHAIERPELFPGLTSRFRLGHAVLVANPNGGTPLATPQRWNDTVGLLANIIEMVNEELPDNPWTTAASLVANGLVWIANHIPANLPGLAAMDANGDSIRELQAPPGPASDAYSVLAANFNPGKWWARLLDAGLDSFFGVANDLVVPSQGAWMVDNAAGIAVPRERIGCFGEGGNIRPDTASPTHHLNYFRQPETVDFLIHSLQREAQPLELLDPERTLPKARLFRTPGVAGVLSSPTAVGRRPRGTSLGLKSSFPESEEGSSPSLDEDFGAVLRPGADPEIDDTLHLMILGESDGSVEKPKLLAFYGSARVLMDFRTQNPIKRPGDGRPARIGDLDAGTRFRDIINFHEAITQCLEGRPGKDGKIPPLPDEVGMRTFGKLLFDTLIRADVKRLYDIARSQQRERPLNVVLTCNIPWLARLPWEFAYDPDRHKFLVTEEVHFLRNVLTSVPAEVPPLRQLPLRMLVIVANPPGTAELATEDEEDRIRHSFATLIARGLLDLCIMTDATPERLHRLIQGRQMEKRAFDIVHFIGHGDFDAKANEGQLLFSSADGSAQLIQRRTLRELFCGRGIQLVFLNACDTARDARAEGNRGIAQSLVEAGLPAVVANQYKVLDPSAVTFAEHFYWSLAHGASLGEAAREARIALNYAFQEVTIDWAVPVLHARDPDYRLCERARVAAFDTGTTPPPATPRRDPHPPRVLGSTAAVVSPVNPARPETVERGPNPTPVPTLKVVIADLARSFPALRTVVERLNQAQLAPIRYQLRLEDLVAPLGIWRREQIESNPPKYRSYLDADRFADTLRQRPRELGADCLICVTDQWLVGSAPKRSGRGVEQIYDLYAWGHPTYEHQVLLISSAGLELPPYGENTERAFANLITAMLADFVIEKKLIEKKMFKEAAQVIHATGAKNCPFYFNSERSLAQIAGRMDFDPRSRRLFVDHLGGEKSPDLRALESMLAAYPAQ